MDSPGTTDDSFYHEITSRYQKDLASGFIYVVNATDPVERARQVMIISQVNRYANHIFKNLIRRANITTLILQQIPVKKPSLCMHDHQNIFKMY